LDAWAGRWHGVFQKQDMIWLRLYDRDGNLILTEAEAERQREEAAEAELARLRQLLAAQNDPE
jgi:hypothetical protein